MASVLADPGYLVSSVGRCHSATEQEHTVSRQPKAGTSGRISVTMSLRVQKGSIGCGPASSSDAFRLAPLTSVKKRSSMVARSSLTLPAADEPVLTPEQASDRILQIHTQRGLEAALEKAGDRLVILKYGMSTSKHSARMHATMSELSRRSLDAIFLLVVGDESPEAIEMCRQADVTHVPHFMFYRNSEVIHQLQGVNYDQLVGDVMYYSNPDAPIVQLHSEQDAEDFIQEHATDDTLVVIDVSLRHCGPCALVYPTVVNLSLKMTGSVVFGRMFGDENESCEAYLDKMNILEVPTFLFLRNGEMLGRYVGSTKGSLVGEILRHQGVQCT